MAKIPYYKTGEHAEYVLKAVRAAVASTPKGQFPGDVLMVGDGWFYHGKFTQPVRIDVTYIYGLKPQVPLSAIVDNIRTESLALIPEGEKRTKEAEELGDIVHEQESSFRLRRGSREISVYRVREQAPKDE